MEEPREQPQRRTRRCGHCREEGHNRSNCVQLQIDIVLNIHGREEQLYNTEMKRTVALHTLTTEKLAQVKLLKTGQLPYVIYKQKLTTLNIPAYNNYIIRYQNNAFTITVEGPNTEIEQNEMQSIREHTEQIRIYKDEYRERILYVRNGYRYSNWQSITSLITIINGDHIRFVALKLEEQIRRDEAYQRMQAVRNNRENAFQEVVNRNVLPIIRDTLIEADDCPICFESLGETNKSILRCGHQVCMKCIITQSIRCITTQNINNCTCPVCRNTYV